MEKTTIELLAQFIKKHSVLKAAEIFGHDSTKRVERWVKDQEIPKSMDSLIRNIILREL